MHRYLWVPLFKAHEHMTLLPEPTQLDYTKGSLFRSRKDKFDQLKALNVAQVQQLHVQEVKGCMSLCVRRIIGACVG